jgi:hypothetical protein
MVKVEIKKMLEFLIDSIFVVVGGLVVVCGHVS